MSRKEFFKNKNNTVVREKITKNKLVFDLQWAAADLDIFLTVFEPEVDKDGFDIILDDNEQLKKIQLKCVSKKAKTNHWKIHRRLLLPSMREGSLGFEFSPEYIGQSGGVILIEIDTNEDEPIFTYKYTDIYIISLIRDCFLVPKSYKNKSSSELINSQVCKKTTEFIRDISPYKERNSKVLKSFFLTAKTPKDLLKLIGVNNHWRYNVLKSYGAGYRGITEYNSEFNYDNREALAHLSIALKVLIDKNYCIPKALENNFPKEN